MDTHCIYHNSVNLQRKAKGRLIMHNDPRMLTFDETVELYRLMWKLYEQYAETSENASHIKNEIDLLAHDIAESSVYRKNQRDIREQLYRNDY